MNVLSLGSFGERGCVSVQAGWGGGGGGWGWGTEQPCVLDETRLCLNVPLCYHQDGPNRDGHSCFSSANACKLVLREVVREPVRRAESERTCYLGVVAVALLTLRNNAQRLLERSLCSRTGGEGCPSPSTLLSVSPVRTLRFPQVRLPSD